MIRFCNFSRRKEATAEARTGEQAYCLLTCPKWSGRCEEVALAHSYVSSGFAKSLWCLIKQNMVWDLSIYLSSCLCMDLSTVWHHLKLFYWPFQNKQNTNRLNTSGRQLLSYCVEFILGWGSVKLSQYFDLNLCCKLTFNLCLFLLKELLFKLQIIDWAFIVSCHACVNMRNLWVLLWADTTREELETDPPLLSPLFLLYRGDILRVLTWRSGAFSHP